MSEKRLGVGFIGSGFNAKFHMLGWKGVRDADIRGVWSPNAKNAEAAARYANELDVGFLLQALQKLLLLAEELGRQHADLGEPAHVILRGEKIGAAR